MISYKAYKENKYNLENEMLVREAINETEVYEMRELIL